MTRTLSLIRVSAKRSSLACRQRKSRSDARETALDEALLIGFESVEDLVSRPKQVIEERALSNLGIARARAALDRP